MVVKDNFFKNIFPFLIILAIYIYNSPPTINTGDSGELTTAVYSLGIAHPPGYILYILLGKFFTLLPFGSIPERLSFLSVLFSVLSLYILYLIFLEFKIKKEIAIGSIFLLAFSYSFFNQSVIIKFYTLNLFIFLLIFYILILMERSYSFNKLVIVSILVGVGMCNHHSIIFISIPIIFTIFKKSKAIVKDLFIFLFISIAIICLVYVYTFIRSKCENLFTFWTIKNFYDLVGLFFRKNYGTGSSLNVAESLLNFSILKFIFSFKNTVILCKKEFSIIFLLFVFIGIFLLRKNFLLLITFVLYFFIFPYLVFSKKNPDIFDYYICGHQYFLPTFSICFIFFAYTINMIVKKLCFEKFKLTLSVISITPFFLFPFRLVDSNYTNHWMIYYLGVDSLFTQDIGSIYIVNGDNRINSTLYLKNIEGFRNDICGFTLAIKSDFSLRNLCPLNKYSVLHKKLKVIFNKDKKKYIFNLPSNAIFYSNIKKVKELKKEGIFHVVNYFLHSPNINKNVYLNIEKKVKYDRLKYKNFIDYHSDWCFFDTTDDLFLSIMCTTYVYYYANLSMDIGKNGLKKISFKLGKDNYDFFINKKNKNSVIKMYNLINVSKMDFYLKRKK